MSDREAPGRRSELRNMGLPLWMMSTRVLMRNQFSAFKRRRFAHWIQKFYMCFVRGSYSPKCVGSSFSGSTRPIWFVFVLVEVKEGCTM